MLPLRFREAGYRDAIRPLLRVMGCRWWRILCASALCLAHAFAQVSSTPARAEASGAGGAGVPFSVGFHKRIEVPVAGATAAYSLDSSVVEATAANGTVSIEGTGPGSTNVIVVTSAGVQTLSVVVPQPPPSYPPGFVPPASEGGAGERGAYEFRYSSNPSQLTNSIEFQRTQGDSFNRLQVTNANLFSSSSNQTTFGFPLASYEISRRHYDLTLIDQQVSDAPLTLDGYLVRGLHVREGDWQFHGGFTSIAIFQGLFLSTDPEYLAGVSRTFSLRGYGSLEGGFYYFQNPRKELSVAGNGGVGSLTYRLKHGDKAKFLAEAGMSHWGLAFAARGNYDDKKTRITGNFRIVPQRFASLAINNLRGTFADLSASRDLSRRWFATLNLNQSDFNLSTLKQNTLTSGSNLTFKLNRNFSLLGGASYSRFQSQIPAAQTIESLNLPLGMDFSSRHFGTGFQYARTDNFDGSGGNDYSFNVRGSARQFLASAFYRHDVQVPTVASVFAQIPGLEDLLQRAGIVITNPDQLALLLNNTALLAALGFSSPLTVNLAPVRNDLDANFSWTSKSNSHQQIGFDYFDSRTELIQGQFRFVSGTVSYSRRVTKTNDLVASASLLRTSNGIGAPNVQPVFSISVRHRFSSVPGLLLPGRHGTIQGHVFRDNNSTASFSADAPGMAGVEVSLDGDRVTHTDANGYYSFHHVPFGTHTIEAKVESAEPFFHTTDSPAVAGMNSTVDFGINFAKGQLFGFLLNDAGAGISGVTVELQGTGAQQTTQTAQTTMEGKFSFRGLAPGEYVVTTEPGTYPPGYSLQNLQPQPATVTLSKPEKIEMRVKAIRAISGKITAYDKTLLKPVPLSEITVRLKELSLEAKTGVNGVYIFRNLPAGTYTIAITYGGKEISRKVIVPAGPASMRDIDLDAGPK
jgi:hypothetical protein